MQTAKFRNKTPNRIPEWEENNVKEKSKIRKTRNRLMGRNILKRFLAILFVMAFALPFGKTQLNVCAAAPKVIVKDYSVNKDKIIVGEQFELTIILSNTHKNKVKNLKLILSSENGDILPAEGTGSIYVEELLGKSDSEYTFKLYPCAGIDEKSYKINIKMQYEDNYGNPYEMEDNIFLPVYHVQRLSVTDILADNAKVGEDIEISAKVNNLGEGTLYNVTASIPKKYTEEQSTYLGNIESGKSVNMSLISKTIMTTELGSKGEVIISYEDKMGNVSSETIQVNLFIEPVFYENLEIVKESKKDDKISQKNIILIVVAVIMVVILVIRVISWKKKKKHLEEF